MIFVEPSIYLNRFPASPPFLHLSATDCEGEVQHVYLVPGQHGHKDIHSRSRQHRSDYCSFMQFLHTAIWLHTM